MTRSERDDIIRYLDNEAGPQPSKVNAAHAIVQEALSRGDIPTALAKTIEAEGYNGQVGKTLQVLRDKFAALPVDEDPPELPPITPPAPPPVTGFPVDPIPNDSVTRVFRPFSGGQKVTSHAGGPGYFSFTAPSGSIQGKIWVNGNLLVNGNLDRVPVVTGDLIEWEMISPAFQDECRYSINR